ncbi:MAG: hypothetical protein AB8B97_23965 [Granulosicoccus sp.]
MIDEELYQQAADELNSDRRRPHIWARACALASDDHDEARYLYTNLRVEELLAEREKQLDAPIDASIIETDTTLALTPLDGEQPEDDEVSGLLDEFSSASDEEDIPSSISAPSGIDLPDAKDNPMQREALTIDEPQTVDGSIIDELMEPDADLMADYVPDDFSSLDDTYADDGTSVVGLAEEDFVQELEPYTDENDENDETADYSDTGVFIPEDAVVEKDFDLDSTSSLNLSADDIALIQSNDSEAPVEASIESPTEASIEFPSAAPTETPIEASIEEAAPDVQSEPLSVDAPADDSIEFSSRSNETAVFGDETSDALDQYTDDNVDDLTQSNMDVLDAHTSELDEMLEDARSQPAEQTDTTPTDLEMDWVEDDATPDDAQDSPRDREPTIIDADPFSDELSRQADELDLTDNEGSHSTFTDQIERDLTEDDFFSDTEQAQADNTPQVDTPQDNTPQTKVAEAAVAATAAAAIASAPDLSSPGTHQQSIENSAGLDDYPLDLTEGRKGSLFSIYRRNDQAQAVKSGVSWSALFLTLPYLIYRQLFGTALAYAVVWIIAIGGLILSGLAWSDAGANVTPLIQASTIGFALLAFIGLVYLPFRYANSWRGEKLEDRGFELVALAKAKNPGKAIARARRYAVLG